MIQKSNRLLQIILGAFLLIAFRIWHIAVVQRDEKLQEALKPQRRTIVQQAERGRILDRYRLPLAANRICYRAAIYYSQFSQIPSVIWQTESAGERKKITCRKNYIHDLSCMLAQELNMDAERIEDLIHSKASLFPHAPYIIQTNLSEPQYYRLKGLERSWVGLRAEIGSERTYPYGKIGSPLIGYLGAIDQKEYLKIAEEIDDLQQSIRDGNTDETQLQRLQELKEKAYTLNDFVGKSGIEKQYEEKLRGFYGKKIFEIDQKGNCIQELAGSKPPVHGQSIVLSLSIELQQFCEELLIQNEKTREKRSIGADPQTKTKKILKQPLIKGGAIVAIDPNNGEILAMAGIPRFDPNDFITTSHRETKINRIHRWLENSHYIANIWDGKDNLYYEKPHHEVELPLTWEAYLQTILPAESPILSLWNSVDTVQTAIQLQEDFEALLYFANHPTPPLLIDILFHTANQLAQPNANPSIKNAAIEALRINSPDASPHWERIEKALKNIPNNSDKLFALDLCRLAVYSPAFTDELMTEVGSMKISQYRALTQSLKRIESPVRLFAQKKFHETEFRFWKSEHQKEFLRQKRQEEKDKKTYARPYIDYLDQKEKELFADFWQEMRLSLLASLLRKNPALLPDNLKAYHSETLEALADWEPLRLATSRISSTQILQFLKSMRSYQELQRPLWGSYRLIRGKQGSQTEQDLASAFYPIGGYGFSRSFAFQSASPLGSIFKLVTACEALRQNDSSPLVLFDEVRMDERSRSLIVASSLDHKPYFRHYKGGRLPRSHLPDIGKVDLMGAIEQSSNSYFAILAGDYLSNPNDLCNAAREFGLGEKSGIDLPGELRGRLPSDLTTNRTGLYSFAIGQHTLTTTPLQVAVMMSSLINGGNLFTPRLARTIEGISSPFHANLAEEEMEILGLGIPRDISSPRSEAISQSIQVAPHTKRTIIIPEHIRSTLCDAMDKVVFGSKGSARPTIIKGLNHHPALMQDYLALQHQMIGKTSTAEIALRPDRNPSAESYVYKHIWFGSAGFVSPQNRKSNSEKWKNPEIVVIVYLRYGDGGKEAAPLAAQVIHKWRQIKKNHEQDAL